jgi:hypothetical protein
LQVLSLERLWNQAYKTGDTKALAQILDNSLLLVEDDGSLKTKSEFLASITKQLRRAGHVIPNLLRREFLIVRHGRHDFAACLDDEAQIDQLVCVIQIHRTLR